MNSFDIRESFFKFFEQKEHTLVPSASLMPTSPNLLFTNAGMNPFVPHFLGEIPATDKRVVDTQKCIRAGGKHNDLDDVGFDTYHHTFFEMLGNWSFGDYFKQEAITWAWELLTKVWGFPKERLYATVYKPSEGDPSVFDQEAYDIWKALFIKEGLDFEKHIINGNKADNFWMMGDTGPCGPCSELHIDLTPEGDTEGSLVNADSPYCIEIWNLVFIQFNAQANGTMKPLKEQHIDTGMGFERVAGIMATTKNFTDFTNPPSNYDSDLFTDIFNVITEKSGHSYSFTLPANRDNLSPVEMNDCIFRVLADHIRTLCFSIADGILPGNEGRNYVLRRILRRAVMFGKRLDLGEGFFAELADPLIQKMGTSFPELLKGQSIIKKVIASEEAAFERTLDRGLQLFEKIAAQKSSEISGEDVFKLYDTYGFPVDLTELLAKEREMTLDVAGFEASMEAQRVRARKAQKKSAIEVLDSASTEGLENDFVGYDVSNITDIPAKVLAIVQRQEPGQYSFIFDKTPFYAEKGGQVGDTGIVIIEGQPLEVINTLSDPSGLHLHQVKIDAPGNWVGAHAELSVNLERRKAIARNHSATHLIHWTLRSVLGTHVQQAGSYVSENHLRFDFSHFEAMNREQLHQVELMVNAKLLENDKVISEEVPFAEKPEACIAFFGDKYGAMVRVVDVGGFSVELCGGTHVSATGEIGLIKIVSESGIAAGTRRIEAVTGHNAVEFTFKHYNQLHDLASRLSCTPAELDAKIAHVYQQRSDLEKQLKSYQQKEAAAMSGDLVGSAKKISDLNLVISQVSVDNAGELKDLGLRTLGQLKPGIVILGCILGDKANVLAVCSDEAVASGYRAGDLVRDITAQLGGKGGGNPTMAMGGAKDIDKLAEVLNNYKLKEA